MRHFGYPENGASFGKKRVIFGPENGASFCRENGASFVCEYGASFFSEISQIFSKKDAPFSGGPWNTQKKMRYFRRCENGASFGLFFHMYCLRNFPRNRRIFGPRKRRIFCLRKRRMFCPRIRRI